MVVRGVTVAVTRPPCLVLAYSSTSRSTTTASGQYYRVMRQGIVYMIHSQPRICPPYSCRHGTGRENSRLGQWQCANANDD